jgi:hypothetical protein
MKGNNTNRLFLDLKKAAIFCIHEPDSQDPRGRSVFGQGRNTIISIRHRDLEPGSFARLTSFQELSKQESI